MIRRRSPFIAYMEILGALYEEPRRPSRLAQACNINYGRLFDYLTPLEEKGMVVRRDGVQQPQQSEQPQQQVYTLTDLGRQTYLEWIRLSDRFR